MAEEDPKDGAGKPEAPGDPAAAPSEPAPKGDTGETIPDLIKDILNTPIESVGAYTKIIGKP